MTAFRLLLPLLGVALLLAGCGADADPNPYSSTDTASTDTASPDPVPVSPVPVSIAYARAADHPLPIETSGRLASKAEIPLAFKIGGVVDRVLVDEGDRVRQGQTLARLDLSEIEARVTEAESALQKARRDLQRTRQLQRDSVATLEELQNARTAVDIAEARLQAARFNQRHAVITAPESGRILRRSAEDGQTISPGAPVFVLGATGRGFILRSGLAGRDVVRVSLGDSATVTLHALPDTTFAATVTEIADAATPQTGTYEVELRLDAPSAASADRLKSGFVGAVRVIPRGPARHVSIPARAIAEGRGRSAVVYTVDAPSSASSGATASDTLTTARRRTVTLLALRDSTAAVQGLAPGTPVITAGTATLSPRSTAPIRPQ